MRNLNEDTITQAVIASLGGCRDERLRTVFTSLVSICIPSPARSA